MENDTEDKEPTPKDSKKEDEKSDKIKLLLELARIKQKDEG